MATDRDLLRHTLAVLAYRATRTLSGAPASFASFRTGEGTWTPLHLVTHLADLMAWATTVARGEPKYVDSTPTGWHNEVRRFFAMLQTLDDHLAGPQPLERGVERLFAGPIADALSHVGQLAMLRRMAGCPIATESYYRADIRTGVVGIEQPEAAYTFTRPPV